MILFLDDSRERRKKFRSHFPSALIVSTAAECIAALGAYPEIGQLWLDHDLGGEEFADSRNENTGMEVVRWIVRWKPKIREIIVHSLNHDEARNMHDDLEAAGYACSLVPFIAVDWRKTQ